MFTKRWIPLKLWFVIIRSNVYKIFNLISHFVIILLCWQLHTLWLVNGHYVSVHQTSSFHHQSSFYCKILCISLFVHGYSFQLTALSSNSFHTQNFPFYNYNKAWWWNLLVWHKHAYGLCSQLCSAAQPTKFESCLLKYSQLPLLQTLWGPRVSVLISESP